MSRRICQLAPSQRFCAVGYVLLCAPVRFVRGETHANLEDVVAFLSHRERSLHHIVALLYKTRDKLENALDIWQRLGLGTLTEPGQDGVEETVETLSASMNKVRGQKSDIGVDALLLLLLFCCGAVVNDDYRRRCRCRRLC